MSHSTVFYKVKPKAHITYIAWEAVPSQISQHLKGLCHGSPVHSVMLF